MVRRSAEAVSSGAISDRSFVRFGGAAGILLALTSWSAVASYVTVAQGGAQAVGVQVFQLLYALVAVWALFAVVAVHQVARAQGEAWSFFATLVGVAASLGTMASALYTVAYVRANMALPDIPPVDPLHLATFGLTGLWFLVANVLLWRARLPRPLVALGFVAAADLLGGFVAALAGNEALVTAAALVAGAAGGPIYWLWLGVALRRLP